MSSVAVACQEQFPILDNLLSICHPQSPSYMEQKTLSCMLHIAFVSIPPLFSVSRSCLPVRVVWWNHGQQIAVGDKYSVVETAEGNYSVIINPVELSDDGEWKVNVENQFGSASSECTLTLRVPKNYRKPRFVENLKAVLTKEGLVSFECKVVGYPTPLLR